MVLKTQTDYAMRTLLFLAHTGRQHSIEEIATAYAISKDHLVKVVQQLVRLGYVVSRAGRTGGVRLAKAPQDINAGKVVAEIEGRNGVLPCINDPHFCNIDPGCVLKSVLIKAEQSFYDVLDQCTIADLLRGNHATRSGGLYNLTIRGETAVVRHDG
jgi:Rrf2 family nitric oxide-sensitive transcriptional repressor